MTIYLENISVAAHLLSITYRFESYRFEVGIWYDIDLKLVEQRYSKELLDNIYFHIAAFEINKLTSLKPSYVDFGKYAHFVNQDFWELWQTVQHKVWAQWRYEHNLPEYKIKLANPIVQSVSKATEIIKGEIEVLSFFGGGKDSLVAARLLERSKIPYSSFVYAHSVYGKSEKQLQIIEKLLEKLSSQKVHKQYVFDSFVDSPILNMEPQLGIESITCAETPSSIFACLPIVLSEGYQYIALGHEHSANVGNLVWDKTGEEINHQWGKSFEAEQLLNHYIQTQLLGNFAYFSLLQPINDVLIFQLLSGDPQLIPFAHSCNIEKPWCKRCPKCAYVWLNYMAYLPFDLVNNIFDNVNLLDLPENQTAFQQMLGFGEHTPFECIGQIEECRLALHICYLKGLRGKAMCWHEKIAMKDYSYIIDKFTKIHPENGLPLKFAPHIYVQFEKARTKALVYFKKHLKEF